MKLQKLTLAIGLMTLMSAPVALAVPAGSGTVTFKGSIIDAPCSIEPGSVDQTVEMGQIAQRAIEDGTATPRFFGIKLENCTIEAGKENVSVTFAGVASSSVPENLGIIGSASGASIALTDGSGKKLALGAESAARPILEGDNTLSFGAVLEKDGATAVVVPGEFQAVANFVLTYS